MIRTHVMTTTDESKFGIRTRFSVDDVWFLVRGDFFQFSGWEMFEILRSKILYYWYKFMTAWRIELMLNKPDWICRVFEWKKNVLSADDAVETSRKLDSQHAIIFVHTLNPFSFSRGNQENLKLIFVFFWHSQFARQQLRCSCKSHLCYECRVFKH